MEPAFDISKVSAVYVADIGRLCAKTGTLRIEQDGAGLSFEMNGSSGTRIYLPGESIRGYEVNP